MFKQLFRVILLLNLLWIAPLLAILAADTRIKQAASPHLFENAEAVKNAPRCGLVLGCAPILSNGSTNRYFTARIATAAELYSAGKVDALIVSGDNGTENYDEPTAMKEALIERGVPEDRIYCDFAGFRTLDSIVRAREIFEQEAILIISQRFHNERALYIAQQHNIAAKACNAPDVAKAAGLKTQTRERFARVKTLLDVKILGTQPKFYGPTVEISSTGSKDNFHH